MAKMYCLVAYIVDPNDRYENGEECFKDLINGSDVYCPTPVVHSQVRFDWKDDLPINMVGCTVSDCVNFMREHQN